MSTSLNDDVIFTGSSFQNLVKLASSHYDTELDAFYELIKNIEDQGAKEITTEFDYENKRVVLYGDGKGVDVVELIRIQKNAGSSSKNMSHHGIGLYCFFKFASRLIFISKKDNEHSIMSITPHPNGIDVYSDVGAPHVLNSKEESDYFDFLKQVKKYKDGTIYILEGVGTSDIHKTNVASHFDIKEVFSFKKYIEFLREKCNFSLIAMRFFVKEPHKKAEHIRAKAGHGKPYVFSVPSSKCPYPKEKTVFIHQGRPFELTLECSLYIGLSGKRSVKITEDHKNALTVDQAYGSSQKINRATSIFRANPLGQYLDGEISFKVYAKDGGDVPSFYSGARSSLLLQNTFGDTLSNMLNRVEIDVMRPALMEFSQHQREKMDYKLNKQYDVLMSEFFKAFDFDDILSVNAGPVLKQKRKCPSCNRELDLIFSANPPVCHAKINTIFFHNNMYTCGMCGHTWEKEQRDPYKKHDRQPLYIPADEKKGTERKRKHGLGYNIHLRPLTDEIRRSMFEAPSTVVINTKHPDYERMTMSKKRVKENVLVLRNMNLSFKEIVEHTMKDNPEKHLEVFEDLSSKFHMWYLICGDDKKLFKIKPDDEEEKQE